MTDNETRVMVVDDARDAVDTLVELLKLNGYVTSSASDGQQAMAAIAAFKPHCVLLDIRMPNVNGLELAKQLRQLYGDDIVLVAITGGSGDDEQVAQVFRVVDHYLTKPIDIERFEKILPRLDR
jgi:CheY-like chemotaxis protein